MREFDAYSMHGNTWSERGKHGNLWSILNLWFIVASCLGPRESNSLPKIVLFDKADGPQNLLIQYVLQTQLVRLPKTA